VFFLKNVVPSIIYVKFPLPSYITVSVDVAETVGGGVHVPVPVFVEVYVVDPSWTVAAPFVRRIAKNPEEVVGGDTTLRNDGFTSPKYRVVEEMLVAFRRSVAT
jgi:hypothetical protein